MSVPTTPAALVAAVASMTPAQFATLRTASAGLPADSEAEPKAAAAAGRAMAGDADAANATLLAAAHGAQLVLAFGRAAGYWDVPLAKLPADGQAALDLASAGASKVAAENPALLIAIRPGGKLSDAWEVLASHLLNLSIGRASLPQHVAALEAAFGVAA